MLFDAKISILKHDLLFSLDLTADPYQTITLTYLDDHKAVPIGIEMYNLS